MRPGQRSCAHRLCGWWGTFAGSRSWTWLVARGSTPENSSARERQEWSGVVIFVDQVGGRLQPRSFWRSDGDLDFQQVPEPERIVIRAELPFLGEQVLPHPELLADGCSTVL